MQASLCYSQLTPSVSSAVSRSSEGTETCFSSFCPPCKNQPNSSCRSSPVCWGWLFHHRPRSKATRTRLPSSQRATQPQTEPQAKPAQPAQAPGAFTPFLPCPPPHLPAVLALASREDTAAQGTPREGSEAGCLAVVALHHAEPIRGAPAGAEHAGQPLDAAFTDAGVLQGSPSISH